MNAAAMIKSAAADGLTVGLSAAGKIKATGGREALSRWRPLLRQHKVDIIKLLRDPTLPLWCSSDCKHLRRAELHKLPPVTACYRVESPTRWTWTRLDKLTGCPLAEGKDPLPLPLPLPPPPPATTGPPVPGLPCAGCGSTSYRRVVNGYTYPDGTRTNGWHCGGRECHVKLLTGNKTIDHGKNETRTP